MLTDNQCTRLALVAVEEAVAETVFIIQVWMLLGILLFLLFLVLWCCLEGLVFQRKRPMLLVY